MDSLDEFAAAKLAGLDRGGLKRVLTETTRGELHVERNGRRLLSFSCNDYLNFTHHPDVKAAAIAAITRYGLGSGSSRLVTGNHPLHAELEARLARLKGAEAACVFGSGFLANAGIVPALIGEGDLVILDELSHACLWAGARLARASVLPYRHNDVGHAEALLRAHRGAHPHVLVATDGVFSMDGDLAPLPRLLELADAHDAWLVVDDAHEMSDLGHHAAHLRAVDQRPPLVHLVEAEPDQRCALDTGAPDRAPDLLHDNRLPFCCICHLANTFACRSSHLCFGLGRAVAGTVSAA